VAPPAKVLVREATVRGVGTQGVELHDLRSERLRREVYAAFALRPHGAVVSREAYDSRSALDS
jgi:hypothetical protein